mmetsp:Transcript_4813/g.15358  ORF Transcript_4813/g.15358 Transcript_4813/m.15358 type:complete len:395 (+) Transcript_4813:146-1330(+)
MLHLHDHGSCAMSTYAALALVFAVFVALVRLLVLLVRLEVVLLALLLVVVVLVRVDGGASEPRYRARDDLVLDDAPHLVVVLELLVQLLRLLLFHLLVVLRDLWRVKEVEEGVSRLLDLDGAHLALLLLPLLHHPHGHVHPLLPLDLGAERTIEHLVFVKRVEQVGLCEGLILEVRVRPEKKGELEAGLAWAEGGGALDVLKVAEDRLVRLLDLLGEHHVVAQAGQPKVGHAVAADGLGARLEERRLLLLALHPQSRELRVEVALHRVALLLKLLQRLDPPAHRRRQARQRRVAPLRRAQVALSLMLLHGVARLESNGVASNRRARRRRKVEGERVGARRRFLRGAEGEGGRAGAAAARRRIELEGSAGRAARGGRRGEFEAAAGRGRLAAAAG